MATKTQRALAAFLALLTVVGCICIPVTVSAEESTSVSDDRSYSSDAIAKAKELLGAMSYEEYVSRYSDDTLYPRATQTVTINGTDYDKENTTAEVSVTEFDGVQALESGSDGILAYKINIPETAKYCIRLTYCDTDEDSSATSIQRIIRINGTVPFSEAYNVAMTKTWGVNYDSAYEMTLKDGEVRYFKRDIDDNEIRAEAVLVPEWSEYSVKDVDGFYSDPFEFVFEKGECLLTFEAVAESLTIAKIELYPLETLASYEEYIAKYANAPKGTSITKIQAEYPYRTSTNTIYPIEDRSSAATSPCDTKRVLLNTIGGEKWQTSQQWISYTFTVESDGLYEIVPRFRQNVNDGMYSSRVLYLYSDSTVAEGTDGYYNGIPFDEARELRFNYSTDWQSGALCFGVVTQETNKKGETTTEITYTDCEFYFKKGVTYTMKLEVSLGSMGEIVRSVQASLDTINDAYLNIMKLTGSDPDENRDYYFSSVMPDTVISLIKQSQEISNIATELTTLAGVKSSNVATLEKIAWLLAKMGKDPETEIAANLEQLKTYIGNLGTWLSEAKTQPLQIDYINIQSADEELPRALPNFFQSFAHEFSSFIMSFFRNYNRMGATEELGADSEAIQVWNAYGRDQAQVIRNLINNDFSPATGITVDLKLIAGGTLLPSILAGQGPDAYIGLGEDNVINYAIRGALGNIENYDGFKDMLYYQVDDSFNTIYDSNGKALVNENAQFNDAAMLVLGIADRYNVMHYYGLPETQAFPMMFIRSDILADLGIESLDTWDDLLEAATVLSQNSMTIGLSTDYKIYLYQMGATLFADDGMRINLDSNLALDSFETMCNMFTMYSFPYNYNFTNRFRTGEMPIGIAGYNGTYNHLIVFATELRGKWEFVPVPGYELTDSDGNTYINNVSVSTVSAIVMINGTDKGEDTWEFMKWHVGKDCQVDYSNEMIAILGDSAKHGTANIEALETMPWTNKERTNLISQFQKLASIPNYPGSYIIGRYTKFSFLGAYNDGDDPVTKLLSYITIINKEITRKRSEFNLETLQVGVTLAFKRYALINYALGEWDLSYLEKKNYIDYDKADADNADTILINNTEVLSEADLATYKTQIDALKAALAAIDEEDSNFKTYIPDELIDNLRKAGEDLYNANNAKFETIYNYVVTCADSLKSYQASYPQG